jgi:hypothetical protein
LSDVKFLAVEDALAADAEGVERDRLVRHLRTLGSEARASLDKGAKPADARLLMALIASLDAAEVVVTRVWAYFHTQRR